jgi:hypothetical protein
METYESLQPGKHGCSVRLGNLERNSTQQCTVEPADKSRAAQTDAAAANDDTLTGFESEGRFSYRVVGEADLHADDSSAALMLRMGGDRPPLSLVLIIERAFVVLGLSSIGSNQRSKRVLFCLWILWFLCRGVFLIVLRVTEGSKLNLDTYVCKQRSTMISPSGVPNRDAQTIIVLLDFCGWFFIYLSTFGGRSHSNISFYNTTLNFDAF